MQIDSGVWIVTLTALVLIFAFDFVVAARRPHAVSMKEAGLWTALYVSLAILFGLYIAATYGGDFAGQFYAG